MADTRNLEHAENQADDSSFWADLAAGLILGAGGGAAMKALRAVRETAGEASAAGAAAGAAGAQAGKDAGTAGCGSQSLELARAAAVGALEGAAIGGLVGGLAGAAALGAAEGALIGGAAKAIKQSLEGEPKCKDGGGGEKSLFDKAQDFVEENFKLEYLISPVLGNPLLAEKHEKTVQFSLEKIRQVASDVVDYASKNPYRAAAYAVGIPLFPFLAPGALVVESQLRKGK